MRQLSKELCIKAAPSIRPITEGDRHTHTHTSLSLLLPLCQGLNKTANIFISNPIISHWTAIRWLRPATGSVCSCVGVRVCRGVCELLRSANDAVKIADKMKVNWYFSLLPLDVVLFLLFCFCFFLAGRAQKSPHTHTSKRHLCGKWNIQYCNKMNVDSITLKFSSVYGPMEANKMSMRNEKTKCVANCCP